VISGRMLHELLLALVGCTGDFVIDEREEDENADADPEREDAIAAECTFKLAPDLTFLKNSERYSISILQCSYFSFIHRTYHSGTWYMEFHRTHSRKMI
jgi:hypothetical protein